MKLKYSCFILLFILSTQICYAADGQLGAITWTYSFGTLYLSKNNNSNEHFSYSRASDYPWYSYRTDIKTIIIDDGVFYIGSYAFNEYTNLTSVTIGNSLTGIGYNVFSGCSRLTNVTIGNSVTSIGNSAFNGCRGLTSVTIGNSVTSIGDYAFWGCRGLTNITIPNSVSIIGDHAFESCSGLASITIPNSVTSIGDYAFNGCSGLTNVTIGNSVTSIGDYAFNGCSNMAALSVELDNPKYDSRNNCNAIIETASNTLLWGCKNTIIPNSVTNIGNQAFKGCNGLASITIPNSVTSIGDYSFSYCSSLTSVTIGNSVTSIGDYAFNGCSGLTNVTIPNSVTSIGAYSFSYCSSLTSVTIPNSVKSIGGYAFYGCSSLTYINIPNSVTSIGDNAFIHCSGLISILLLPETPPTIGSYIVPTNVPIYVPCETLDAYKATDWKNYNIKYVPSPYDIEISINNAEGGNAKVDSLNSCYNSVSAIPNYGYHFTQWSDGISDNPRSIDLIQDTALTAIFEVDKFGVCGDNNMLTWNYADDGILTISGNGALNTNYTFGVEAPEGMKQLIINEGVTSVGDSAFFGKQLTSVILPQTLTNIGASAFSDNKVLTKIVIPNKVTTIGDGAFENGNRLQEITLGESIETIGNNAFKNCPYIITVHANMEFPPVIDASVFADCGDLSGIDCYVPQNSLAFYKKTAVWKQFNLIVGEKMFVLTARPNYPDMGSVEGTGSYAAGVEVTLKATAKSGCHFLCWNDGEKEPVRRVVVTNDAVYTALFAADEAKPEEQVNVTITDTTANLNTGLVQDDDVVTYRLVIYYQDTPVCTLSLDREGHLTGIDFHGNAPRRMPQHTMLAAGELNIPITGLHSGTTYHYVLDALDKDNNIIERREGDFTTSGVSTSVDNLFANHSLEEVFANKETQIYTLQGIEVTNMRERLPQGTYIFRLGDKVGKAMVY